VASYVLSTYGWRPGDIGLCTAIIGIAGTLASPIWGRLDDRTTWAPRAAVLASSTAAVAAALTLGRLPHAATWLAFGLFGATRGSLDALLATRVLADDTHRSRLGRVRSYGSVGWVLGLVLAATVLTLAPAHAEWVLVAAAVTAVTAPWHWGDHAPAPVAPEAPPGRGLPLREVLGVLALTFTTPLATAGLVQFTAGWAHAELSAGPFLALAPIALSAALELPAFRWVDHLARARTPLLLAVLAGPPLAVATGLLALFPSGVTVLAVQPLVAASFAFWYVGQSRMLARAVGADRQASAQTLGSALSVGCGGLLAGVVGGHVADSVGYGGLFASLAAVAAAGSAIGGVALWRRRSPAPSCSGAVPVGTFGAESP
jgi:predicted MFS family arabinose efflux permease